jgi:hypothetical protein
MKMNLLKLIILPFLASISINGYSQVVASENRHSGSEADSLGKSGIILIEQKGKPDISLTTEQAVEFLQKRLKPGYWKNTDDRFRNALEQLVFEASHPPYDSTEFFIRKYPMDSLDIPWEKFYSWVPLRFKVPFVTNPESPLPADSSAVTDSTILVMVDTLHEVTSDYPGFPFTYYEYPYQGDSVRIAANTLLDYVQLRDSSLIYISGPEAKGIPVWLNSKSGMMQRYWLRNEFNDSVTVWIGASSRNTLELILEKGVTLRRPVMQGNYSEVKIDVKEMDKSKLLEVKRIAVKTQYWRYRSESVFALNQASLTNWVKGGEGSISTSMDITGYANYDNKALKITSNNFARLKYGLIKSGDQQVRKNLDLLETNSKLNHKAFGKFDFSAIMLFKTQLAAGYAYPTETTRVKVSKFMNPAILTLGFGLDYKPNKNTSVNFSPLSYKGTFVTDTANIDQTKYGIPKDKKSLNEPGASFMITNEYKPFKSLSMTNRFQLFTNYINHPQNIDVDWEMILTANINWFTDVRFNTHLIFDDDTRTTVLDKEKKPMLGSDGKPIKTARIQFKELLGFSFIFRF